MKQRGNFLPNMIEEKGKRDSYMEKEKEKGGGGRE